MSKRFAPFLAFSFPAIVVAIMKKITARILLALLTISVVVVDGYMPWVFVSSHVFLYYIVVIPAGLAFVFLLLKAQIVSPRKSNNGALRKPKPPIK